MISLDMKSMVGIFQISSKTSGRCLASHFSFTSSFQSSVDL